MLPFHNTKVWRLMAVNLPDWQHHQQCFVQSTQQFLATPSVTVLLQLSEQLCQSRLQLNTPANADWLQQADQLLPSAMVRIELLLTWCRQMLWPEQAVSLLLTACYCSSLTALLDSDSIQSPWQRYPALACIKRWRGSNLPTAIAAILAGCYGSERKLPQWRMPALSILLTLAEQLSPTLQPSSPPADLPATIASKIQHCHTEFELTLLRQTLDAMLNGCPKNDAADQSIVLLDPIDLQSIQHYSNRQLEGYLQQQPAMAAVIMKQASQINRQQQTIDSVRLAINLLGRDTLPPLLADSWLQQKLRSLNVPGHLLLLQFSQCLTSALQILLPQHLSSTKASVLAHCICAPMWLAHQHFSTPLVALIHGKQQVTLSLPELLAQVDYATHCQTLLQQSELDDWLVSALALHSWLNQQPTKITQQLLVLIAAWQGACVTLFNAKADTLHKVMPRLLQTNISQLTPDQFCQTIATHSQCYCPLSLML